MDKVTRKPIPGSKAALVYGQMNEPPGARARVALTGLAIAEFFRDQEGQDVLLFVDNIFRFTQAGSEVSALLGRIPSAVGYQPTLATDMGLLQERITSTGMYILRYIINMLNIHILIHAYTCTLLCYAICIVLYTHLLIYLQYYAMLFYVTFIYIY